MEAMGRRPGLKRRAKKELKVRQLPRGSRYSEILKEGRERNVESEWGVREWEVSMKVPMARPKRISQAESQESRGICGGCGWW